MDERLLINIEHEELLASIKNKEFFVVYQPKVNIYSGELLGVEALIRWKKDTGETIYPSEFIPKLERTNLIHQIDFYMIRQIIKQFRQWKKENKKIIPISLNLYKSTLLRKDFIEVIDEILDETDFAHYIEFELTERGMLTEEEIYRMAEIGSRLKKRGFKLAIDDYGIGSSNLLLFIRLHVNTVKLDKLLIKDLKRNKRTQIVLKNVIKLCYEDNIKVVVEGVEDQEELNILKVLGCNAVQGYYFSKPVHIEEIKERYNLDK